MIVYGEYNSNGYQVYDGAGNVLFTAGNHRHHARRQVDPRGPKALGLAMLRRYCAKATREIAHQHQAGYGGVRRRTTINIDSRSRR